MPSQVVVTINDVMEKSRFAGRDAAHTFRRCFAAHHQRVDYYLGSIRLMLGYSNVLTTIICTHCVPQPDS
ncbi:MAG: hypothetical protein ACOY3O_08070 [Thermodesulfobacteriota bacterium]